MHVKIPTHLLLMIVIGVSLAACANTPSDEAEDVLTSSYIAETMERVCTDEGEPAWRFVFSSPMDEPDLHVQVVGAIDPWHKPARLDVGATSMTVTRCDNASDNCDSPDVGWFEFETGGTGEARVAMHLEFSNTLVALDTSWFGFSAGVTPACWQATTPTSYAPKTMERICTGDDQPAWNFVLSHSEGTGEIHVQVVGAIDPWHEPKRLDIGATSITIMRCDKSNENCDSPDVGWFEFETGGAGEARITMDLQFSDALVSADTNWFGFSAGVTPNCW